MEWNSPSSVSSLVKTTPTCKQLSLIRYNPTFMRKAAVFYNPLSGRRRERRVAEVEAAARVLREAGVEAFLAPTRGAAESGEQAREAIASGCDTILACGGDGTVHDLLQGVAGSEAALGIIPLGTANALAHDLLLPRGAASAARAMLTASLRRVSIGQVSYIAFDRRPASRYFIVAAGVGVDAHLFYALNPLVKSRLGMAAYYVKATRLWLTHPLENFEVEIGQNGATQTLLVSQLLAVRIRNFGGVLRELAPGASLDRDDLRLVLFRTRSRIAYLRYVTRGLLARPWTIPGIELMHSKTVVCRGVLSKPKPDSRIFVEADGELLGTIPAEISIAPMQVNLLVP